MDTEYILLQLYSVDSVTTNVVMGGANYSGIVRLGTTLAAFRSNILAMVHNNMFNAHKPLAARSSSLVTGDPTLGGKALNLEENFRISVRWVGPGVVKETEVVDERDFRRALAVLTMRGFKDHVVVVAAMKG